MTQSWRPATVVKVLTGLVVSCSLLVLLVGTGLNNIQVKYSRFRTEECRRGLYVREIVSSDFCCDTHYHDSDWACAAAYDFVNETFTSFLAWIIPLVPLAFTVAADVYHGRIQKQTGKDSRSIAGTHVRRLACYVALFLYRTVVLYAIGGMLEDILQQHDSASQSCWYLTLTTDAKCKKDFDYSDHVVLFMTHFLVVTVFEISYILHSSSFQPFKKYALTMLSAAVIYILVCRALFFTGMFFHTAHENLAAFGMFVLLVLLPLWPFTRTRLFNSLFY